MPESTDKPKYCQMWVSSLSKSKLRDLNNYAKHGWKPDEPVDGGRLIRFRRSGA